MLREPDEGWPQSERNPFCKNYDACLTAAADLDSKDLSCEGCRNCDNARPAYGPEDAGVASVEELERCFRLLCAVFYPGVARNIVDE
jgi:hypothetical protein